ncbi:MAG: CDGSH iron-sulfur domain-containing protein [Marinicaulis sp.]|nr:CDGSH iron-sulfur domain-containing protein [Marinicaulis sp.]
MDKPQIAGLKPCLKVLEKGRPYLWCSCGRSLTQPFCDGSHKGTPFMPVRYVPQDDNEEVLFCNCKQTKDGPHCDGSHNNLPGADEEDDPESIENKSIDEVFGDASPLIRLNGECYIFSLDKAVMKETNTLRYTTVIASSLGAVFQSQFFVQARKGTSEAISFGNRHVVLYMSSGATRISIGDRSFDAEAGSGAYIRPHETFQIKTNDAASIYISACPTAEDIPFVQSPSPYFDEQFPSRIVPLDENKREAIATRYFQILVDKSVGSTLATQFIGHIPYSKAMPHRHLYEEALIILSGEGMMWTETKKATVKSGDVIFLPRKQLHSLQSTGEDGLDVVGVIYPGDNPSINY